MCCKTVSGLEGLGANSALDEPNGKAEVISLKVLPHVPGVKSYFSAQVARPGALFALTSVD